jgi:hypothetical protein
MLPIEKKILRVKGNRWCELQVRIEPRKGMATGHFSICGAEGEIHSCASARRQALEYWEGFFEGSPNDLRELGERFDRRFKTPRAAARFVLETDGEYHGLDAYKVTESKVYTVSSCGQIREEIAEFFPEAVPYFKWHLNDMRVSKVRTETVTDAHGRVSIREVPEGASWEREELPPEVLAWVEGL